MHDDLDDRFTWEPIQTQQRGLTDVESVAERLILKFPFARVRRTQEVVEIATDESDGLVMLILPESLEIRTQKALWSRGTHGPVMVSRLRTRLNLADLDDAEVEQALADARKAWRESLRECRDCHQRFPADHFIDAMNLCHSCAERDGVVF